MDCVKGSKRKGTNENNGRKTKHKRLRLFSVCNSKVGELEFPQPLRPTFLWREEARTKIMNAQSNTNEAQPIETSFGLKLKSEGPAFFQSPIYFLRKTGWMDVSNKNRLNTSKAQAIETNVVSKFKLGGREEENCRKWVQNSIWAVLKLVGKSLQKVLRSPK